MYHPGGLVFICLVPVCLDAESGCERVLTEDGINGFSVEMEDEEMEKFLIKYKDEIKVRTSVVHLTPLY